MPWVWWPPRCCSARVRLSPQAQHEPSASPFFFGDIAALPGEQFVAGFLAANTPDATRQILVQVHRVLQVVARKYHGTRRAAVALAISLVLWAVVLWAVVLITRFAA